MHVLAQYQNQQLQENFGKKPLGALRLTANIITNEGLQGLYRGFVSTCTREVGGYFFFFGGYQLSKRFLTPAGKTADDLGPIEVAISGGIAGACFWSSVFPTDVVKSRIQTRSSDLNYPKGFVSLTYAIFRKEAKIFCGKLKRTHIRIVSWDIPGGKRILIINIKAEQSAFKRAIQYKNDV
ncbi:mitochondrial ornithine transporter 2-like isoform X3 [Xenia sp. Carnegie-2017]|uniref:mitochondrial ornithine transporter 2-like isoform X3 n=1 Tax=Xenia sp. Carnegie-2017 TaxID=2897299 RepID=UPI001F03C729|nr:mitochondrial ornithine transporter 2-like isoform X3 [Xenia sp. Carnegie-2017]